MCVPHAAAGHSTIVNSGPFFYKKKQVDAAALGIPNLSRRDPGSKMAISFSICLKSKKSGVTSSWVDCGNASEGHGGGTGGGL
jgi:hypothetical protein